MTLLVLRNEEYAILKWFAEIEGVTARRASTCRRSRRRRSRRATGWSRSAWTGATHCTRHSLMHFPQEGPRLVEVKVAPGMALG